MRLSKSSLGSATIGQTVNILSNDVIRFERTFVFMSFLIIGPVQTAIVVYLLWSVIGKSVFIGVMAVLLVIPIQGKNLI